MKPKSIVTVGICVRNCEAYVKDAIKSILEQDFPHGLMEIIFVDDGSEDDTLSIIEEFVSKIDIPTKVFHTPWKGIGHARNMVVDNAKGDFIVWVDGDMIISKDFVKKQVEFMEKHPKIGAAKGRLALERSNNLLATLETLSRAAGRMVDYQSEKTHSKALGTGGAIYRIKALLQVGGFDEKLRGYGEDWDVEIKVKSAGWSLCTTNAQFLDLERHGLTWKVLWKRYWLRGYYTHYFFHKNGNLIRHYRMFPPAAFLSGLLHANKLFKLTHLKMIFILPFQYVFKMSAWYSGFIRSHLNSYQPR